MSGTSDPGPEASVRPDTRRPAPVHRWLAEPMERAVANAIDRAARFEDVRHVAVMPDVHVGTDVCIGTAMATRRLIYPAAVGGDIGCGMLAMAYDVEASALRSGAVAGHVLRGLKQTIPGSRRHRRHLLPWPAELDEPLSNAALDAVARDDGRLQLGTLGGGNHFVELQADDAAGQLWLMIHSGSRQMGQAVRAHHVAAALATKATKVPSLDADAAAGRAYLHDAAWASRYAKANRRAMAECVTQVLRDVLNARPVDGSLIACDHNHVRHERHFGEWLWVHRKGAMPADAGLAGVVPGSMGTCSYHVEGRGCDLALRSSAHGAGRRFSRAAARERFATSDVRTQLDGVWYDPRDLPALREEAPQAYKDVRAVLRAQAELVKLVRTLRPVLGFKTG
jgi:tRNA-splicing ligase RtcB